MGHAIRILLTVGGLAVALLPAPARAVEYPYCLSYVEGWAGMIEICDFTTLAQCQASAGGLAGTCGPNRRLMWNRSQPVDPAPVTPRKRPRS